MDINLCPKIHYVLYHNPPQYSSPPPANFVSHDRTLPNLHFTPTVLCVFVFVLFITVCVRITDVRVRITDAYVRTTDACVRITDVHIANSTSSSRFYNLSKATRQPLYMGHFVYAYGAICVLISIQLDVYISKETTLYPKSNLSISKKTIYQYLHIHLSNPVNHVNPVKILTPLSPHANLSGLVSQSVPIVRPICRYQKGKVSL